MPTRRTEDSCVWELAGVGTRGHGAAERGAWDTLRPGSVRALVPSLGESLLGCLQSGGVRLPAAQLPIPLHLGLEGFNPLSVATERFEQAGPLCEVLKAPWTVGSIERLVEGSEGGFALS